MAVSAHVYGVPVKNQYDGTAVTDYDADTIKVALLDNTHTPDIDTHDFFSDVSGDEITGTGYTAGGATLASKTITYDTGSNQVRLDAADTSWTTATFTARYAVIYKDTGTASTSPLIAYVDFDADQPVTAGTFTITWAATGILAATVS